MGLTTKPGSWLNIFLDIEVACVGKVKRWEFYASKTGVFYASIWRKTDGSVTLVGKNRIEADAIGRAVRCTSDRHFDSFVIDHLEKMAGSIIHSGIIELN